MLEKDEIDKIIDNENDPRHKALVKDLLEQTRHNKNVLKDSLDIQKEKQKMKELNEFFKADIEYTLHANEIIKKLNQIKNNQTVDILEPHSKETYFYYLQILVDETENDAFKQWFSALRKEQCYER